MLRAGSIGRAREVLERLAASQPPGAAGACARGELALLAGDWGSAGAAAEQALRLDPELLPATTTLAQALLHLDPPRAEELVAVGITRWGYSDARLIGVGVEQGLRAQTFAIAVQNVFALDEFLTSQARAATLHRLTAAVWARELHARHLLLVAPYCFGGFIHVQYRGWAQEQLQLGRRARPDDAGLQLAEGLQAITVHIREGQPLAPPDPCLAAWAEALQREPGLLLPLEHAERFAALYPDHPLVTAWRQRPEPRPPLPRFLSDALRSRR